MKSSLGKQQKFVPQYTLAEELVNAISHGVGAGLAIAGMILCLIKASSPAAVVASVIYGVLMFLLFMMSCLYHAISPRCRAKRVLRVIDHANVFLMVAGTYMPICLSLLSGALGWVTFGVVWAITIVAVVFSCIDVDKYQVVGTVCNLLLGWGVLVLWAPLLALTSVEGMRLLIMGGVAYTVGSVLYTIGAKVKWMHSFFHMMVLGGAILHWLFIYLYCL